MRRKILKLLGAAMCVSLATPDLAVFADEASISTVYHDSDGVYYIDLAEDVKVVVDVTPETLVEGFDYTARSCLFSMRAGNLLSNCGETVFSPDTENVTVEIDFDSTAFSNDDELYVYTDLIRNNVVVAEDHNTSDSSKALTINAPKFSGTLTDQSGNKEVTLGGKITLKERTDYFNLVPGKTYTIKYLLKDPYGSPVYSEGAEIMAEATFTPSERSGSVEANIEFDGSDMEETDAVVTGTILLDGREVGRVENLGDSEQTVKLLPRNVTLSGKAYFSNGSKNAPVGNTVTVNEEFCYTGLSEGSKYTAEVYLVDKSNSNLIEKQSVDFAPYSQNGCEVVSMSVSTSGLGGHKGYAVIDLYDANGKKLATLDNSDDKEQIVNFTQLQLYRFVKTTSGSTSTKETKTATESAKKTTADSKTSSGAKTETTTEKADKSWSNVPTTSAGKNAVRAGALLVTAVIMLGLMIGKREKR